MNNLLEMDEFLKEGFSVDSFLKDVKSKDRGIGKDISDKTDVDGDTGLVTITIETDGKDDEYSLNDVNGISKLGEKKYKKYYKGTDMNGDKTKIYIKFQDDSLKK